MSKVIRLKSLHLRAFRSYIEETVEFPQTGMMLLRGSNLDTKGGSGSGKSTIIEALNFGLDFASFPSTELQSWLTEKPLQVTLELSTPLGDACVTRGDKPKFSGAGRGLVTGATAVANALDLALGLDAKILKTLTCRSQRKDGMFLSLTDSEKKEFLTPILGVGPFEKAVDDAQKRISELQKKQPGLAAAWEQAKADVATHLEAGGDLTLPIAVATLQRLVDDAWTKVQDIQAQEDEWKYNQKGICELEIKSIQAEIVALEQAPLPEDDYFKLAELRGSEEELMRRIHQARLEEGEAESARRKYLAHVAKAIDDLRDAKRVFDENIKAHEHCVVELDILGRDSCPTCNQTWMGAEAGLKRDGLLKDIETLSRAIAVFRAEHPGYDDELADLQDKQRNFSGSVDSSMSHRLSMARSYTQLQIQELVARTGSKKAEAIAELKAKLSLVRNSAGLASPFTQEWKAALDEHSELELMLVTKRAELDAQVARVKLLKRLEDRVVDALAAAQSLETDLAREQDFQDMLKDFLAAVFDEALAEISDETNHILAGVPNTANVTLQFRSETMTQKGTAKKSIVPVMTVGGHEAKLGSGCSGGMISSVELATDLAVRSVVSRRLGVRPGWIVLDEPFEGLGPVEKEGYLEIIREYGRDNLVIVVDHSSEFKEFFTQIVEIEYRNGISKVVKISHDN